MYKLLKKMVASVGRLLWGVKGTPYIAGLRKWHAPILPLTLAELLATTGDDGAYAVVTDYKQSPLWKWVGAANRWVLTSGWWLVSDSAVYTRTSTNTATDLNDQALATYTIPANILRNGMAIRLRWLSDIVGTTGNKYCWISLGGNVIPNQAMNSSNVWRQSEITIYVNSDAGGLIMVPNDMSVGGSSGTSPLTYTVDPTQPINITVNAKFSQVVASESISLRRVEVELLD